MRLDCRGMRCPLPVVELAKAWAQVAVGETVELLSDDPAAAADVPAWCRMREQAYDGSPAPGTFLVRRLR
ncbi:MAG TPA: sulfurtransferase TusA family protein [Mycobacteriales bacterium]|nr:sulfurtransferase TusA family protein [Mycobacteriales bacterium]